MDNQTEARICEGLVQAQQGNFVPDKEMEEFFAQYVDDAEAEPSGTLL